MIHVSSPTFLGREAKYVADVMASGWLTQGPYVERLEAAVCDFTGAAHAVGDRRPEGARAGLGLSHRGRR